MIDREYGESRLICDECGDWQRKTYDRDEFMRMLADAKDDGWSIKSGRGEWVHLCPKCNPVNQEDFEAVEI